MSFEAVGYRVRRMRALVAAGERAARIWPCVGCAVRGTGDGVAVVHFMDVAEDGGGRAVAMREGAIVFMCVLMRICVSCSPLRPARRVV